MYCSLPCLLASSAIPVLLLCLVDNFIYQSLPDITFRVCGYICIGHQHIHYINILHDGSSLFLSLSHTCWPVWCLCVWDARILLITSKWIARSKECAACAINVMKSRFWSTERYILYNGYSFLFLIYNSLLITLLDN